MGTKLQKIVQETGPRVTANESCKLIEEYYLQVPICTQSGFKDVTLPPRNLSQ